MFAAFFHLEIFPLSNPSLSLLFLCFPVLPGLRKGNEIMTLNGEAVSDLDLKQMEALFSEKSVGLTLIAQPPGTKGTLCTSWSDSDLFSRDQKGLLPPPNQSQLLEEFLDNFKKNTANGECWPLLRLNRRYPQLNSVGCSFAANLDYLSCSKSVFSRY